LADADYTATNGTTVVLTNAATLNDSVVTESFYVSSVLNAIPATAGAVNSTYIAGGAALANIGAGGLTQTYLGANVAGNGPAFSAYATVGVSTPNNTATKISFDSEEFDTNSNFASSRFTPTVAGYYQITAGVTGGFSTQILNIYKNGAEYKRGAQATGSSMTQSTASALVYCNGSTDYIEVYWFQASGSTQTSGVGQALTYFQGFLARAA
jgi:hypothetical protein